jgi:hypothetical protein
MLESPRPGLGHPIFRPEGDTPSATSLESGPDYTQHFVLRTCQTFYQRQSCYESRLTVGTFTVNVRRDHFCRSAARLLELDRETVLGD